jgi:hypothetical protein
MGGVCDGKSKRYRCAYHYMNDCNMSHCVSEKKTERFLLDNIEEDFKVNVTLKPKKRENPKKYRDRLKRLNNIYLMGNISESEYKKEAEILQKKIAELSKQEQPKTKSFEKGWKDLYETLTEENKRSFWRSLIKGVEVDENGQPIKILY